MASEWKLEEATGAVWGLRFFPYLRGMGQASKMFYVGVGFKDGREGRKYKEQLTFHRATGG